MAEPAVPRAELDRAVAVQRSASGPRGRLGAAMRDLIEAVVLADDEAPVLDEAAARIEQLTATLREHEVHRAAEVRLGAFRHGFSLVGGAAHPFAPQLVTHENPDGSVTGTVTLGQMFQGGPGLVHGGILSLLFDHTMGHAAVVAGHGAMTVSLTVSYKAPTPLYAPLQVTCRLDRKEGRKLFLTGEILVDGGLTATADAVFVTLTGANISAIFRDGPTPPGMTSA